MGWEMARSTTPKAKKTHHCDCCGIIIPIGATYNRVDGKYEGEMCSTKIHPECERAFGKATAAISNYIRPDDELFLHDLGELMIEAGMDYESHLVTIREKYRGASRV